MTKRVWIRGRIIRIVDSQTVLINLGRNDGITDESIFRIIGEVEDIFDPEDNERLGQISVVKGKVKASQVHDRFTVATSRWTTTSVSFRPFGGTLGEAIASLYDWKTQAHEEEFRVDPDSLEPWKAQEEEPVQVGDTVEVEITVDDEEAGEGIIV